MVSFKASLSPEMGKAKSEFENLWKKRNLEEPLDGDGETLIKRLKTERTKPGFDMELHLDTPLPIEWQRCLDLQSGTIHFYNSRTDTRTCKDPRTSPECPSTGHMSLDLELKLPCVSNATNPEAVSKQNCVGSVEKKLNSWGGLMQKRPWLTMEEAKEEEEEMVATVCRQCHMLVMLIKSSPACPNCKFRHPPPDPGPPKLFNQRLSLLC
ncbi:hypothetical protein E1A91_A02G086300v1 [Gossypium mustelinum]|uniref:WW domain-containing protein n=1 Tax=Gossypium mustelinum TaxID=34275 RepID=A0A5D3A4T6_GOSMU|nr:hypothetical protein E1A91_A02G086300v1 [Gossypium mustelinum]